MDWSSSPTAKHPWALNRRPFLVGPSLQNLRRATSDQRYWSVFVSWNSSTRMAESVPGNAGGSTRCAQLAQKLRSRTQPEIDHPSRWHCASYSA